MTQAELTFYTRIPNLLNECADNNKDVAEELKKTNELLRELIEVIKNKQ